MKSWLALALVFLAGCSALPEQGTPMKELTGRLLLPGTIALPPTATAHVTIVPALSPEQAKPAASGDFPARTGTEIPFELRFPAAKVAAGGEYLVFAQVIDSGKVWYSNLASPLRISFLAEPGSVTIELRAEKL